MTKTANLMCCTVLMYIMDPFVFDYPKCSFCFELVQMYHVLVLRRGYCSVLEDRFEEHAEQGWHHIHDIVEYIARK